MAVLDLGCSKVASVVLLLTLVCVNRGAGAQPARELDELRRLETQLEKAQQQDVAILAPARFAAVRRVYEEVEASVRMGTRGGAVLAQLASAHKALEESRRTAESVRRQLSPALEVRQDVLRLDPALKARTRQVEQALSEAAARAEAGDAAAAERLGQATQEEYSRIGITFLREEKLVALKKAIDAARGKAPEPVLRTVLLATAVVERELGGPALTLEGWRERIEGILDSLYPLFYRHPPTSLVIDGFVIQVESYDAKDWDFQKDVIVGASGTGWVSFRCGPGPPGPFAGLVTTTKALQVVQAARGPSEIDLASAQRIDPSIRPGSTMELRLPAWAESRAQVSRAIEELIESKLAPKGQLKVHFEDFTIEKGPEPDTGWVIAGAASCKAVPPVGITVSGTGFRLLLSHLELTRKGSTATGELEFPESIVDPGTGHPGRIDLGPFAVTATCGFHKEIPDAFGAWSVGNTGMEIQGKGILADFDKSWAAPGLSPTSAAAQESWRGAILRGGGSVPATPVQVSNTGYLGAKYSFSNAEVTAPGLLARFTMTEPFEFETLQPAGYRVRIQGGWVSLRDSAVEAGQLTGSKITVPKSAALSAGGPVEAQAAVLSLSADLELFGPASPTVTGVEWGEYTRTSSRPTFFRAETFGGGQFYLSGTNHTNYFPVHGDAGFLSPVFGPGGAQTALKAAGLRGLTLFEPRLLSILTGDTPNRKPLVFVRVEKPTKTPWVNFSFGGVHANLEEYVTQPGSPTDLGPTPQDASYVGKDPFRIATVAAAPRPSAVPTSYSIALQFVSSASHGCDMRGKLSIPMPVGSGLAFEELAFTSTAEISGAKVPFDDPFPLAYWGLDMVKKPGADAAGVISVKTGQVFFTAAGIREERHFDQPFYLIWGEMLANGALNRLVFDYSGVGQKFDRFAYKTAFVRLSDYDPAKPAFLKTAGTVHFDVFGPRYIQIDDFYDPQRSQEPWKRRRIDGLSGEVDAGGLYRASEKTLKADWSGDLSAMDYDYDYDRNAQDGFVGKGSMVFFWISGPMTSTIVLKGERICTSVLETQRHDFKLGPVAHFGQMGRTSGCGCIEGGQLRRLNLTSELETQENVNIALRAASYTSLDWAMTPSVTTLEVAGDMYLTILLRGNLEIVGRALFTIDRANDFVEGEVDGRFDAGTALGFGSVTADGRVNWHIGTFAGAGYQSIQGRLAVTVVTPVAGWGVEGGFYAAINAPKDEAWVLAGAGPKFRLNMTPLPDRLTGIYGYCKASRAVDLYVISGGVEAFAGLGGFILTPQQVVDLGAQDSGLPDGLPYVVGNAGVHIWGEILGGLVSAGGWVDLDVIVPYPFSYQGTLGLEGCALWVACASVDVSLGLNSTDGFLVN
jgi:hypothetical protein